MSKFKNKVRKMNWCLKETAEKTELKNISLLSGEPVQS
jgi:hypothetical protein